MISIRKLACVPLLALALCASVQAQQFFRIGTGGTAGTYYPVGGMIANAVSVPGKIIATAQASNGSVANVSGIAGGAMESGFTQADVASWAYKGNGLYEGKPNVPGLRGNHALAGAGHWVQRERAAEVNALLIEFLRGL